MPYSPNKRSFGGPGGVGKELASVVFRGHWGGSRGPLWPSTADICSSKVSNTTGQKTPNAKVLRPKTTFLDNHNKIAPDSHIYASKALV